MYLALPTLLSIYPPALLAIFSTVFGAEELFTCSPPASATRLSYSACHLAASKFIEQHPNKYYILRHEYSPSIPWIKCPHVIEEPDCVLTLDYKVTRSPGSNPYVTPREIMGKAMELAGKCVGQEDVDGGNYITNPTGLLEVRVALAHSAQPLTGLYRNFKIYGKVNSTVAAVAAE